MSTRSLCWAFVSVLFAAPAFAQFDSGSDGSDGVFNPLSSVTVDLSLADSGPGTGTHDPDKWAVIFNYTTITIPSGVTVSFTNHSSGAPVVWLAQGPVTIDGTVSLDGGPGSANANTLAQPGPGGFAGGRRQNGSIPSSGGFGPGGGQRYDGDPPGGASYGTQGGGPFAGPTYGSPSVRLLIGGSGGGGGPSYSGGAGGGAILIASSCCIMLDGTIQANGGDGVIGCCAGGGGGSGGAIRLIADTVSGVGSLTATGGGDWSAGGAGRIRVEAYTNELSGTGNPIFTCGTPGSVFPPSSAPTLRVATIDGIPVPTDPDAGILTGDVVVASDGMASLLIEATNVPVGTTVTVRIVPDAGSIVSATSTPLAGSLAVSTATATIALPTCRTEIQLRANWTP